jgi:hypothetical protein
MGAETTLALASPGTSGAEKSGSANLACKDVFRGVKTDDVNVRRAQLTFENGTFQKNGKKTTKKKKYHRTYPS